MFFENLNRGHKHEVESITEKHLEKQTVVLTLDFKLISTFVHKSQIVLEWNSEFSVCNQASKLELT